MTIEGYQHKDQGTNIVQTQLTAPGTGEVIKTIGVNEITAQYKIAAIDTSVAVRLEGSLDNTNWGNLDADEADTTQTANGTYFLNYKGKIPYVRFNFVSEAGGTGATIDVVFFLG